MDIKKHVGYVMLFLLLPSCLFAGGVIKKGKTFKATEDVRYFTLEESRRLLKELDELAILRKQVVEYQANEKAILQKMADYERVIQLQAAAIQSYQATVDRLERQIAELRLAVKSCQDAVKVQADTIKILERRERRNKWKNRIENVLWGAGGALIGKQIGAGIEIKFK